MHVAIPAPYWCQYDNQLYPGGSCNMTSLAMALDHYKLHVPGPHARTPDNLLQYCDDHGLDRHELGVIRDVAVHFGLADDASYAHTFEEIKAHLATGQLVIVQGAFTPSGHVILVCGVDSDKGSWLCNDPAGDYEAPNHYRNPGWRSGEQVWYPSDWFSAAAAPDVDGKVWAHLLVGGSTAVASAPTPEPGHDAKVFTHDGKIGLVVDGHEQALRSLTIDGKPYLP